MPLTPPRLAGLLLLAAATAAVPGTAGAACQVDVDAVAFGVVELDRRSTGTGRVEVTCDAATAFEVGIAGAGSGGSSLRMRGPGNGQLAYELYQDAANAVRWGDGGGSGAARGGQAGADAPARLTVYGVVPRQDGVPPGTYLDQLQVTLRF